MGRTEVEDGTSTNGMVLDVLSVPFDSFNMILGVVFSEISGLNLGFSLKSLHLPDILAASGESLRSISSEHLGELRGLDGMKAEIPKLEGCSKRRTQVVDRAFAAFEEDLRGTPDYVPGP